MCLIKCYIISRDYCIYRGIRNKIIITYEIIDILSTRVSVQHDRNDVNLAKNIQGFYNDETGQLNRYIENLHGVSMSTIIFEFDYFRQLLTCIYSKLTWYHQL